MKTISEAKVRSIIREEIQMVLLEAQGGTRDKIMRILLPLVIASPLTAVSAIQTLREKNEAFDKAFVEFFKVISPENSKPIPMFDHEKKND
jgi:hypothetical protein